MCGGEKEGAGVEQRGGYLNPMVDWAQDSGLMLRYNLCFR